MDNAVTGLRGEYLNDAERLDRAMNIFPMFLPVGGSALTSVKVAGQVAVKGAAVPLVKAAGQGMVKGAAVPLVKATGQGAAKGAAVPLVKATGQGVVKEAGKTGLNTRFITTAEGVTTDLQPTLNRITSGGKFPHPNDGSIFKNSEGLLPKQNLGFYKEFVHPTPGVTGRPGTMRIVTGQNGSMWFTPDHYETFIQIR